MLLVGHSYSAERKILRRWALVCFDHRTRGAIVSKDSGNSVIWLIPESLATAHAEYFRGQPHRLPCAAGEGFGSRVQDESEALELAQETFVRVYVNRAKFSPSIASAPGFIPSRRILHVIEHGGSAGTGMSPWTPLQRIRTSPSRTRSWNPGRNQTNDFRERANN